ncbi:cyclophane-forming radical SAM peptide maturase AmcB [Microbispora sp. GKU 823]|uniref:cyclophane-forming radical SAM peptide maturase AmcB n=1 Tax=Microbispora sp. GKU 823 TaxID=1652100 RepID=UPI0009A45404|nr:cyclophane-forming radical SAM peptide maturase AmcB [Microbispora sp. GKU 823]
MNGSTASGSARRRLSCSNPPPCGNLDCSYCYLPNRKLNRQMPPEVLRAVVASAEELTADGGQVDIVWHGGEPLTIGASRFTAMLAPFEELRRQHRIRHQVQTNATLLSDQWCKVLTRFDVRVGVSIDGPAHLNGRRVDLRGQPAFARTIRGIRDLRRHGIPFSIIAVVGPEGIAQPEALLDFLMRLEPQSIGLNIEELEGANTTAPPISRERAEEFWARVLAWSTQPGHLPVLREVQRVAEYLRLVRGGQRQRWDARRLDPIPTIAWNGDVVLLSPELGGIKDSTYGDFLAGNVLRRSIPAMLADAHRLRYVQEYINGLRACRAECAFWDFCRGAQAGNRYFEHGSFSSTETAYCRLTRQSLITALTTAAKECA